MKGLSDRLYERTGFPLSSWVWAMVAVIGFSLSVILAHNAQVQHQREQQQIQDTLREIRDKL
jgi:hypothetical protein